MKSTAPQIHWFQIFYMALICCYVVCLLGLLWWGSGYYFTPFSERLRHPLHNLLKPTGRVGHSLGMVGAAMMLLSFLYSLQKRWPALQRIGTPKEWLQFHIFLGLGGPALVVLHCTGKLSGVAAIALYSTMAMVLSGMVGRYLYSKIPRTKKGTEMSLKQMEEQLEMWVGEIHQGDARDDILQAVEDYLSAIRRKSGGIVRTLLHTLLDDLSGPIRIYQVWRIARMQPLSISGRLRTCRFILKQRRLLKHLAVLEASQKVFSFWHIFHKPFTFLSSTVSSIHVAVAVYFGYGVQW